MTRKASVADKESICILVLGMHRGGTSAVTRTISLLGADLPKTLIGASENNLAGYWESSVVRDLNDSILDSAGTSWDDWEECNAGWFRSPKVGEFHDRALAVLEEEFGSSRLFVLKDPRISRILPFWLSVLESAGIRSRIVFETRNPLETGASLEKRNGFDPAYGHLLWLRHMLDAEHSSRGVPRIFTSYDRLLKEWNRFASDSQQILGITWPRLSRRTAAEIDAFLQPGHRHHSKPSEALIDNEGMSNWLRETYRILDSWAAGGERAEDFETLDRFRAAFNESTPAFSQLAESGKQALATQRRLRKELAKEKEAAAGAQKALAEQTKALAEQSHVANAAKHALDEMRKQLTQSESALAQSQRDAAQNAAELDVALQKQQHAEALRTEAESIVERYKNQVQSLTVELEREKADAQLRIERLEARLNERFGEIAILTQTIVEKEGEIARLRETATLKKPSPFGAVLFKIRRLRPFLTRIKFGRKMERVRRSGNFDAGWYLSRYKDVAESGQDPLLHFVQHGANEGRYPNARAETERRTA